jgi:hypothetical protein
VYQTMAAINIDRVVYYVRKVVVNGGKRTGVNHGNDLITSLGQVS